MQKKHFLLILSFFSINTLTSLLNVMEASEPQTATPKRALAVDDTGSVLMSKKNVLKNTLGLKNEQVDTANDAEKAIILTNLHEYDVILTDGDMGEDEQNVNALVKNLRSHNDWRATVPIIIESANINYWQNHPDIKGQANIFFFNKGESALIREKLAEYKNTSRQ